MMPPKLFVFLALTTPPSQPGQPAPPIWTSFIPFVLLFVIMYFMLIRPQQKKAREQANLMKSLKRGDKIATSGGILASVVSVGDSTVTLRSADSKFEVRKDAVTEILERSTGAES